jgi:phage shock protein E
VQKEISKKIHFLKIFYIVILSSISGLLFNYFNPDGLTLISFAGEEENLSASNGKIEFFQPVLISAEDANLLHSKNVQFIDTRSPDEYENSHIPSAINIPEEYLDNTDNLLSSFADETPFVIYNQNDNSYNKEIADKFFKLGYKRIYIFNAGFDEWTKNNYPVTK